MATLLRSADTASWSLIAAVGCASAVAFAITGLSFDVASAGPPAAACAVLVPLAMLYRTRRPDPKLATLLTSCAQLVAFMACAESLSYALARADRPFWDGAFLAWDRSIALDWRAYLAFVNDRPWMSAAFNVAYKSLLLQFIGAIIALSIVGELRALRVFVLTTMIAGLATVVISAFMPALTMYARLGLQAVDYPNVDSTAAFAHVMHLGGVREGTLKVVSLTTAEGIVAFPSFHASLGVAFILAFWHVRRFRWPALTLNAVMIAATPLGGGHYFVDVAAGMIVAAVSAVLAEAIDHRKLVSDRSSAAQDAGEFSPGLA